MNLHFPYMASQNSLEQEHIDKVVQAYDGLADIDKFMRIVSLDEFKENDYNLNIARYIDTSEDEEQIDIPEVLKAIADVKAKEKEIDDRLSGYLKELGYAGI